MEDLLDKLIALVKTQQKKCRRHGLTEEIHEVREQIRKEHIRADAVKVLVDLIKKWREMAAFVKSDHNGSSSAFIECANELEQALAGMEES